ncbi:MAG: ABC transporter permease [Lentisphaerae bacterium]|nr:ABC transporter permease [Lentisphaerota bacterium]
MHRASSLFNLLWRRRATRLCLILLACYTLAALWGEGAYRLARWRDRVPAYNRVREDWRYQPPALVQIFASSRLRVSSDPDQPQSTPVDPSQPQWEVENDKARDNVFVPPEARPFFLLGSDNLGRDVLQRLLQGTRIAFHVGVMTSLIALPLGVLLGCLGGYFGGRLDSLVVWLCATVSAVPGLLLILAISLVAGKGLAGVTWGIGLTTWVGVCRSIRAEVLKHRGRTYVEAARVLGYSHARILLRHILPNVMHIVLISFSIRFPAAVSTEVFVSFLGIGVQGEPSWGVMLNNARLRLWQGVWWEMTFVTLAIFGLVLVFNVLTDRLRDLLDPDAATE